MDFAIFVAVDAHAVLRASHFADTEPEPRLFPQENRATEGVHVHAPARLEYHPRAVLEHHPADTEILHFCLAQRGIPRVVQAEIVGGYP